MKRSRGPEFLEGQRVVEGNKTEKASLHKLCTLYNVSPGGSIVFHYKKKGRDVYVKVVNHGGGRYSSGSL